MAHKPHPPVPIIGQQTDLSSPPYRMTYMLLFLNHIHVAFRLKQKWWAIINTVGSSSVPVAQEHATNLTRVIVFWPDDNPEPQILSAPSFAYHWDYFQATKRTYLFIYLFIYTYIHTCIYIHMVHKIRKPNKYIPVNTPEEAEPAGDITAHVALLWC